MIYVRVNQMKISNETESQAVYVQCNIVVSSRGHRCNGNAKSRSERVLPFVAVKYIKILSVALQCFMANV